MRYSRVIVYMPNGRLQHLLLYYFADAAAVLLGSMSLSDQFGPLECTVRSQEVFWHVYASWCIAVTALCSHKHDSLAHDSIACMCKLGAYLEETACFLIDIALVEFFCICPAVMHMS